MRNIHSLSVRAALGLAAVGFLAASAAYAAPVLSQTSVTVGLGQSIAVTSQTDGLYVASNSNISAVGVSANGTQITVTGKQLGTASVSICSVGSGTDCTNLAVTVQNGSVQTVTLSPNSISLAPGGVQSVTISGSGTYNVSGNSNSSAASASLSGSVLTVSALAAGDATITVCDQTGACGTVSVSVTSSGGSSQAVVFGIASPTLTLGQSMGISISGGSGFFISSNSSPSVVQASVNGSTITLYGASAGTDSITVCASSGGCSTLTATVANSSGGTQTTASTGTATTNSTDNATLLGAIQSMQSQLAQILAQIQTMATTLTQLASSVSGTSASSAGSAPGQAQTQAYGSSTYVFTEFLSVGSQDAEVTALQVRLTALGFYSGPITGYFGPLTESAVKKFQSAHGIDPAGYIGPSTRTALNGV